MNIFRVVAFKTVVFIVAVILVISLIGGFFIKKASLSGKKFTVVIDAGHGGIDGGASGVITGVRESDLNLLIAKNLKSLFEESGFVVIMTRETDEGLYGTTDPGFKKRDLKAREEILNGSLADVAVSIHLNNYSSKSRRGAQVFYNKKIKESKRLAGLIQSRLNGVGRMARLSNPLSGDYYLLNQSKVPTVIVECGFLSSPEDEELLLSEDYRADICDAIYKGCVDYLSV